MRSIITAQTADCSGLAFSISHDRTHAAEKFCVFFNKTTAIHSFVHRSLQCLDPVSLLCTLLTTG